MPRTINTLSAVSQPELIKMLADRVRADNIRPLTRMDADGNPAFSLRVSKMVLEHVIDSIRESLLSGRDVRIKGLGTLRCVDTPPQTNSLTGKHVPSKRRVKWRPHPSFNNELEATKHDNPLPSDRAAAEEQETDEADISGDPSQ